MIYYFGTGEQISVVFNEKYLTEAEQSEATLVVESETAAEVLEGKIPVRYIDPITKQFSWRYKDAPTVPENEQLKLSVQNGVITPEQYQRITGVPYTA